MNFKFLVEESIRNIKELGVGEHRIFSEDEIECLRNVDRPVGLFSEQTTCFALFADPAQVSDSTGMLLVSQIRKGSNSEFYIQKAAKLPPLSMKVSRELILSGCKFLSHLCKSDIPVHIIMDVTGNPEEINELKDALGDPRPNIHDHMLEKASSARENHIIGKETITAFGIRFHSKFGGQFEAFKNATISKEFMVFAVKLLISQNKLHMDWDLMGATDLCNQMRKFKCTVIDTSQGRHCKFGGTHDDLVDALLMLGYWSYLRLIQPVSLDC